MISAAFAILFGLFAMLLGGTFIWYAWTELFWLAAVAGLGFGIYGYFVTRGGFHWLRMRPAASLQLFENHFCIGRKRYSYTEFRSVEVRRIHTRKRLNFVPAGEDETVIARLYLFGEEVDLRAGSGPSTLFGPSMGQAECDKFFQTLQLLQWRAKQLDGSLDGFKLRKSSK